MGIEPTTIGVWNQSSPQWSTEHLDGHSKTNGPNQAHVLHQNHKGDPVHQNRWKTSLLVRTWMATKLGDVFDELEDRYSGNCRWTGFIHKIVDAKCNGLCPDWCISQNESVIFQSAIFADQDWCQTILNKTYHLGKCQELLRLRFQQSPIISDYWTIHRPYHISKRCQIHIRHNPRVMIIVLIIVDLQVMIHWCSIKIQEPVEPTHPLKFIVHVSWCSSLVMTVTKNYKEPNFSAINHSHKLLHMVAIVRFELTLNRI